MSKLLSLALLAVVGLMAYVRLAPVDVARWHVDLARGRPPGAARGGDPVVMQPNGATADLPATPDQAFALLTGLDAIALATPRTRRLAGSVESGHVTWETRSRIWGFPDYTTAQITPGGLTLYARQRFGAKDFGVNAARLRGWLAQLPSSP